MKRLFSTFVFAAIALCWVGSSQQPATAQGKGKAKGPPEIEFVKPNVEQKDNTIHWEIKVKPRGATINKVTLDILPRGGNVGQMRPLASGRGYYQNWEPPVFLDDGVFREEGKAKKLPPGVYSLVVIVTYNGNKTAYENLLSTIESGNNPASLGHITEDMDYLPNTLTKPKRIQMHGKYVAPDADHSVNGFTITLLAPDGKAHVKDVTTAPKYDHTFDPAVTGLFGGYVRASVTSAAAANVVGTVYTTHRAARVP